MNKEHWEAVLLSTDHLTEASLARVAEYAAEIYM